jgi:hypothetical protein
MGADRRPSPSQPAAPISSSINGDGSGTKRHASLQSLVTS